MKIRTRPSWITFLVLVSCSVNAQPYQSIFGSQSTSWSIILEGACDNVCSNNYSIFGDTTINSNLYMTLKDVGFIREDTTSGKVWFYDTLRNIEHLVMDLSLAPGDTFYLYHSPSPIPVRADSVYYVSGKKHIRLEPIVSMCLSVTEQMVFVEGSGPNVGFHYQDGNYSGPNPPGIASYMLCHHKDQVKVQGNLLFWDSCAVCFVGIEEHFQRELSFEAFPNAFNDEINFEFEQYGLYEIRITDMTGRVLASPSFEGIRYTSSFPELSAGTYIVKVRSEKHLGSRMIVKE